MLNKWRNRDQEKLLDGKSQHSKVSWHCPFKLESPEYPRQRCFCIWRGEGGEVGRIETVRFFYHAINPFNDILYIWWIFIFNYSESYYLYQPPKLVFNSNYTSWSLPWTCEKNWTHAQFFACYAAPKSCFAVVVRDAKVRNIHLILCEHPRNVV